MDSEEVWRSNWARARMEAETEPLSLDLVTRSMTQREPFQVASSWAWKVWSWTRRCLARATSSDEKAWKGRKETESSVISFTYSTFSLTFSNKDKSVRFSLD
jgi:hypothetical protein